MKATVANKISIESQTKAILERVESAARGGKFETRWNDELLVSTQEALEALGYQITFEAGEICSITVISWN